MIVIVGAVDRSGRYSLNGKPPWEKPGTSLRIPKKELRQITAGNIVIMGKGAFEMMERKPLSNCLNILVSETRPEGAQVLVEETLHLAIKRARKLECGRNIYIIGGAHMWREALPLADEVYLIEVKRDFVPKEGEVAKRFPEFENFGTHPQFKETHRKRITDTATGVVCELATYSRK